MGPWHSLNASRKHHPPSKNVLSGQALVWQRTMTPLPPPPFILAPSPRRAGRIYFIAFSPSCCETCCRHLSRCQTCLVDTSYADVPDRLLTEPVLDNVHTSRGSVMIASLMWAATVRCAMTGGTSSSGGVAVCSYEPPRHLATYRSLRAPKAWRHLLATATSWPSHNGVEQNHVWQASYRSYCS
jgi:hypothetical protein